MNSIQGQEMLAAAERHHAAGRLADTEALCRTLIKGVARDGPGRKQLVQAYEYLVDAQCRSRGVPDAVSVFRQYLGDGAPECDQDFDQMYCDALLATQSSPAPLKRRERFFSLANMLQGSLSLKGLVAECGSFRGLSSYVLCRYLKLADSSFDGTGYRIFDSFEGLSEPQPEDEVTTGDRQANVLGTMKKQGSYAAGLDQVRTALNLFPAIEFFPGWIPEAFPDEPDARYRFVHVDVDLYQPTRDSLDYFYPRLVPGGTIVCDDFNWPGAAKAIKEFCASVNARFSTTPYQQAYIVRRA